jgi:hypothetical protein
MMLSKNKPVTSDSQTTRKKATRPYRISDSLGSITAGLYSSVLHQNKHARFHLGGGHRR